MTYTIDKPYENLIEIKKSKFIAYIFPIESVESVDNYLSELNKKHKDATHICYAYILNNPNLEKCSDDGEPDGTAGKPILEVIKKNNLTNVLLVVVRYFGGIKLGAGGLVRAYSGSGSEVVKLCKFGNVVEMAKFSIICNIEDSKKLLELINKSNIKIIGQEYSTNFKVYVMINDLEFFNKINFYYESEQLEKLKVFYDKDK